MTAPVTARPDASTGANLEKRFARLAFYNILANVTVPLAGLVDAGMLGHLDQVYFLAGVALASIIFDYVFWTFGFLRMATTGLAAQAVGRDDRTELQHILQRSALIAVAAGSVIVLLRDPIGDLALRLLSGDPATESAARAYYDARVWGAPAALLNFAFLGWFLGREESRIVLVMTLAATLSNVALNYLFIVRWGMAAQGAGLATMLSQYLMLAIAVGLYLPRREAVPWRWRTLIGNGAWRPMFQLQRDILIRTLCLVSAFAVFTDFSARLGTEVLAANALLLRIVTLSAFLIDGAAFATESLAGILHGGGRQRALRRLMRLAHATGLAFAAVFALLLLTVPDQILGLLTSHRDVVSLGVSYRLWLVPVLLLGAPSYIYDGLFLGVTAGRALRNSMLLSAAGVFLPLALWALYRQSPNLLWLALGAFMAARTVTLWRASRTLLVTP